MAQPKDDKSYLGPLIVDASQMKREAVRRRKPFDEKSVTADAIADHEAKGWQFDRKLKRVTKVTDNTESTFPDAMSRSSGPWEASAFPLVAAQWTYGKRVLRRPRSSCRNPVRGGNGAGYRDGLQCRKLRSLPSNRVVRWPPTFEAA
jgi:hypothetical protein